MDGEVYRRTIYASEEGILMPDVSPEVQGDAIVNGDATVGGDLTVTGNLSVTGTIDLSGTSINSLSDVDTTGAVMNGFMYFDGTDWVASEDISHDLGNLTESSVRDSTNTLTLQKVGKYVFASFPQTDSWTGSGGTGAAVYANVLPVGFRPIGIHSWTAAAVRNSAINQVTYVISRANAGEVEIFPTGSSWSSTCQLYNNTTVYEWA